LDRPTAVQLVKFVGKGPDGLSFEDRNDSFEPCVLSRVHVDGEPARRERRILQRLQVLPHVVDDGFDEIPGRATGSLRNRAQLSRSHGMCFSRSIAVASSSTTMSQNFNLQFLWISKVF